MIVRVTGRGDYVALAMIHDGTGMVKTILTPEARGKLIRMLRESDGRHSYDGELFNHDGKWSVSERYELDESED